MCELNYDSVMKSDAERKSDNETEDNGFEKQYYLYETTRKKKERRRINMK